LSMTLNNLKHSIQTATAETDRPLLQNVWHEFEYHLEAGRATN
jgi:hypothetical protein